MKQHIIAHYVFVFCLSSGNTTALFTTEVLAGFLFSALLQRRTGISAILTLTSSVESRAAVLIMFEFWELQDVFVFVSWDGRGRGLRQAMLTTSERKTGQVQIQTCLSLESNRCQISPPTLPVYTSRFDRVTSCYSSLFRCITRVCV